MDIGKQKGYKRPMTLKKTIEQHKYTILFCLILVFGSILRLVQLGKVPGGYQMDEAYGAFNAYSLFHSGIDSTGHSYPVYFESWGGGQNALNSYLMLPFMVFTGGKITPLVVRLPQAIVAILSLVGISSGWELVATAAKADASQKLPITKVSTVPYNCCKIFPMQIGNANCAARPKIEPCVISILLIFIDNYPLCKNGKYLNCRM